MAYSSHFAEVDESIINKVWLRLNHSRQLIESDAKIRDGRRNGFLYRCTQFLESTVCSTKSLQTPKLLLQLNPERERERSKGDCPSNNYYLNGCLETSKSEQESYILRYKVPCLLELLYGSMLQGGHELHEGAKVLLIHALLCHFNQKFQHLHSVREVSLVGYTPHEKQRHLQQGERQQLQVCLAINGNSARFIHVCLEIIIMIGTG